MSPVFRHGRLRLYLLKLLDESPRHGYEVIRLLQDRFMGVYAPSPGTIYPRLARLEEEGLVTHDEADGRKVYRITEKGREELRNRSADLSDLEEEITASVRDIAREVTEDVRETVRNLREELTWAARDMQRRGGPPPGARGGRPDRPDTWWMRDESWRARDEARRGRAEARQARAEARHQARSRPADDSWAAAADDPADRLAAEQARLDQEQDRLNSEQARLDQERERVTREQERLDEEQQRTGVDQGAAAERLEAEQDRLGGEQDRLDEEQDRLDEEQDRLDEEQDRLNEEHGQERDQGGSRQHGPRRGERGRGERGRGSWDWPGWADWPGRRGGPHGWADPGAFPDLDQLARHFTRELREAAAHAQAVSEEAVGDLRGILDDALDRIKAEVFGSKTSRPGDAPPPDQDS
jgi:DNA-binding PadR family transcriptional regulator